ncbi:MAG TPA: UbiX family flavin prenyltransferase [Phycisphaerae bacterium]|nr:UbiX family flavin prenyltransferase [Phycisphaerae bacterium]
MTGHKRFTMGITGASGALYAKRILEGLCAGGGEAGGGGVEIYLVISTYGRRLLHDELGIEAGGALDVTALGGRPDCVTLLPYKDVGASIASGSFKTDGMVVVPCSNNKLAEIAHGLGDNLISRAANVCLKERRKLVLVHREMPLGLIEINNMKAATEAGAIVCPANPGFYHLPTSVEEVVDTVAARVLDLLGVEHDLGKRWGIPSEKA